MDDKTRMLVNPITIEEAHELYLQLTDIQTQLESGIGDASVLTKERRRIRWKLITNNYNPDNEPKKCWPESQQKRHVKTAWATQTDNQSNDIYSTLSLDNGMEVQIYHPYKNNIGIACVCVCFDNAVKFKHEFNAVNHADAQKHGFSIALQAFETALEKAQQNANAIRNAMRDLYPEKI